MTSPSKPQWRVAPAMTELQEGYTGDDRSSSWHWQGELMNVSNVWNRKRSKQHLISNFDDGNDDYVAACGTELCNANPLVDPLPTDVKCKHCLKIEAKLKGQK